jgi:hypothetical protein
MSDALIRKAFETRLKTWAEAQVPAIPVAWPNVPFTAPAGRYIRAHTINGAGGFLFVSNDGRSYRGIFQVSLVMPTGTGRGAADTLAASLEAAFDPTFVQDGVRLYLLAPFSQATAIQEPDRYVVPVSAPFRAYVV